MECNKDEAIRAKELALRKLTEKDIAGAKKFALKAQNLYPGLEGISQMLTIIDVYTSAENKVRGETDWYGILGVNPLADDETIKKHYKKLALLLHPDKNKSTGADGAFQFVSEAFSFLSDKTKRLAYNQKLNIRPFQQRVATQTVVSSAAPSSTQSQQKFPTKCGASVPQSSSNPFQSKVATQSGISAAPSGNKAFHQKAQIKSGGSSAPTRDNGHHKHSSSAASTGNMQNSSSRMSSASSHLSNQERRSFWTVCNRCRMQYEYLRQYLNQILLCPHCNKGFKAVEIAPPSNLSTMSRWVNQQQHQKSYRSAGPQGWADRNSSSQTNVHWEPFLRRTASTTATQPTTTGQMGNEKAKREHMEAYEGGDDLSRKRRILDDKLSRNYGGTVSNPLGTVNWGTGTGSASTVFSGSNYRFSINGELSQLETRNILMQKTVVEIGKKLNEWRSACEEARAAAKDKQKAKERERQKSKLVKSTDAEGLEEHVESLSNKSSSGTSAFDSEKGAIQTISMNVPDSDFHDFDADRTEFSFSDNDVWAAYDNDDGMPRFYALIQKVISLKPFKMLISWLNSKSNIEFGSVDWVGQGFTKTCGEFRVGRHETNESLNSFSHKVNWTKGSRGVVQIYPTKGEIWALYRNWSPDWDMEMPVEVRHVYEMVEVVDNYVEDQGVTVAPLIKAPGFRTVFCRKHDSKQLKRIPKEEMFRFSHSVPSHLLTAEHAPKGCLELDPAATPLALLQVGKPANEGQAAESIGSVRKVS
ncbi:hypothetical protein Nepgr_010750 [Nepenthes gracilis]|uniref:J domain-containing protein n=1 Tax=Nepenthes gracilis TaxID=150966 RepID=A0AAD3XLM4_NEPGR|nr:hypothetical protein Nepgr_010750 [Nepenthes gracilis]